MSLIAEALRKAGHTQKTPAYPTKTPSHGWWRLLAGAGMIGGGIVLMLSFRRTTPPALSPTPSQPPPAVIESAPKNLTPPPKESEGAQLIMEAQSQWQLNGIIRGGDGKALALINGHLMEEGGTFQGIRLVRISRDEVEIEQDGQRSRLTLR